MSGYSGACLVLLTTCQLSLRVGLGDHSAVSTPYAHTATDHACIVPPPRLLTLSVCAYGCVCVCLQLPPLPGRNYMYTVDYVDEISRDKLTPEGEKERGGHTHIATATTQQQQPAQQQQQPAAATAGRWQHDDSTGLCCAVEGARECWQLFAFEEASKKQVLGLLPSVRRHQCLYCGLYTLLAISCAAAVPCCCCCCRCPDVPRPWHQPHEGD